MKAYLIVMFILYVLQVGIIPASGFEEQTYSSNERALKWILCLIWSGWTGYLLFNM